MQHKNACFKVILIHTHTTFKHPLRHPIPPSGAAHYAAAPVASWQFAVRCESEISPTKFSVSLTHITKFEFPTNHYCCCYCYGSQCRCWYSTLTLRPLPSPWIATLPSTVRAWSSASSWPWRCWSRCLALPAAAAGSQSG